MGNFNKYLAALLTCTACLTAQATTRLELDRYGAIGPDPYAFGAPWGLKRTEVFTVDDGVFSMGNTSANSVRVSFRSSAGAPLSNRRISVSFSTDMLGVPLQVGTYLDAERFPFNAPGHPGLDLTDTGSGFNTLDGQFRIFDVQRNASGKVTSFAASFEIFNQPAPTGSPLLGGRVWYNSDARIPAVPEPGTWLLFAVGAAGLMASSRRKANLT